MGGFGTITLQAAWLPTLTDKASRKSLDVYLRGFHEFVLRSERTRP